MVSAKRETGYPSRWYGDRHAVYRRDKQYIHERENSDCAPPQRRGFVRRDYSLNV